MSKALGHTNQYGGLKLDTECNLRPNSIHMNDDMVFLGQLSVSDFYSLTYGPVIRLAHEYDLRVQPIVQPHKVADMGEWGGLQHANHILSQRFPSRDRHYLTHMPQTVNLGILHEAMQMFKDDLALAATRPFREVHRGNGDISFRFLVNHLRIERWREALLWVWAVGKMGQLKGTDQPGIWGPGVRNELKNVLSTNDLEGTITVMKPHRTTLEHMDNVFDTADWARPKSTRYTFSSLDGHLPAPSGQGSTTEQGCRIDLNQCFSQAFLTGQEDVSASDMFKRLAFAEPDCGDCRESLLTILD